MWKRKLFLCGVQMGVQGANASTIVFSYLGGVDDDVNDTKLHNEPTKSEEERKRKWKGKW